MKTKKSIWSIALSLIIVLALVVGINLNMQPKTVNAENENDEHITFDVKVDDVESKSVARNYAGDLVVTYTVTETTGVDALQLRLGYDHDAFTLKSVVTNNDTTLGDATKGKNGEIDNDNVVYENVDTEGITFVVNPEDNEYQPVLLITATFNLNNPTAATAYTFSLYNPNDEEELNIGYSRAWRIESADEQSATHAPVQIRFANEAIVYVRGSYTDFTLEGGSKTYDGIAVPNSAITITHGENTPEEIRPAISAENVVWFTYNEALWQEQNVSRYIKLDSNPVAAGTYYAVVEFNGNNFYDSYKGYTADELYGDYSFDIGEGKVAEYVISPRAVNVTIDSKESAYGETLKPLTYTVDTQTPVIGNDDLGISLFSDANSLVPGTSPITGSAGNANYAVSFTNGTYTVTARNVTIIIADKESVYGAPIVELTYTIDENTPIVEGDNLVINLSTTATSSSNVGTYPITGTYDNAKYVVTFRNTAGTDTKGTYTITSQNINALNYFTGDTVTFDANSHNLLIVDENIPSWVSYTAENNNQTNANTYTITITVTISTKDALNYLSSDLLEQLEQTNNGYNYVTTVQGKINPVAVTVTADDKGHVYGKIPATLTPVTVGVNNEVTVNFVVKNGDETITLSTETPAGTYTIVPSATNSNYVFTFNNGTYTVSPATVSIDVNAEDIFYNRNLDYDISVFANSVEVNTYEILIVDENNHEYTPYELVQNNTVLDAGTYTIKVIVPDTVNYPTATETATFKINKIAVETPTVTYNGSKATWAAVSNDAGATNVNAKELNNSTVTYTIGGTEYSNREFTPTAAGNYTLVITPSNGNYLPVEVQLETVYSVVFTEGTHTATQDSAQNMPNAQYVFKGQKATQPATNPSLTGYTFNGWDFDFNTAITENTTIPAIWTISQRTMTVVYVHSANSTYVETSKTFNVNYNSNVVINTSNFIEKANITDIVSQYNLNGMRYTFNGFWNYKVTGEDAYIRENVTDIVVNATQNYTFVALYNATPINYEITYMYRVEEGENPQYIQYGEKQTVAYNAVINYTNLTNVAWFRAETWFADQERTTSAPVNMPANNLTVYGAYVFNIGLGDVNADGNVDDDDITLYRRWIVGGYEMTEIEDGTEWDTVNGENFNANGTYFLTRVADDNAATLESTVLGDQYLDIRDVSTIRMAMVGGYGFSILEGNNVDGEEIVVIRTISVNTASDLLMLAKNGKTVELTQDITDPNFVFEILDSNKDIIIDLKGHTLTLKSFRVTLAEGNTGKILVTNGRINVADGNGVYLTAVDGSVHLDDVTLYDDNGLFVIQTADHSLHLFNVVRFLKKEIVNNVATEVAAVVNIADKTHIVVEPQANLIVEKLVVEQNAEISITVNSAETAIIAVEGTVEVENNVAETKVYAEENALLALVKAAKEGGEFTLEQDYEISEPIIVEGDLVLNLNGHNIYNTKDIYDESKNAWSLISVRGGNLTINGNGELLAKANDCYAIDVCNNGTLTVNGGTYTGNISAIYAHDGFVTVNGGEFAIIQKMASGDANRFMLNCLDASYKNGISNFTVNGGTFNGFNPADNASEGTNTNYVTAKHYVEENNGVYTVKEYGKIANEEELLAAVENGGKYQLVADFEVNQQVTIEKDFTLEGNNHTITFNKADSNNYAFYVVSENVLSASFSNLNIVSTGYQVAIMTNLDAEGSLVNVNNVDITCDGECVYANGYGVVNANNCDFTRNGEYAVKDAIYYSALVVGYAGTINATDCTVNSDRNGVATFPSGGFITLNNTDVTVNGNGYAIWARNEDYNNLPAYNTDSVITINSGNVVGEFKITDLYTTGDKNYHEPKIVITGGTFDHDPTAYMANGYYYIEEDNIYTVYEGIHTYAQLVEAAAKGGDYTLTADIDLEETIAVTADMTLRLNGHRIYNTQDLWVGANWSLISVRNGANLTIKGDNGILDAKANDCFALDVKDNGTITLDGNGTYIGNLHTIYAYEGIVTINGGSFDLKQLSDGTGEEPYRYELNCYDSNYRNGSANFVVKGGSFTHFNPQGSTGENPTANYIAEGYYAVEENGVYTVKAGTTGSGQDPVNPPISNPSFPF